MGRTRDFVKRYQGWIKGINKLQPSFMLGPGEAQTIENFTLGLRGELNARAGMTTYDTSFAGTTVDGAHRYIRSDNVKKAMLFYSGNIYVDADDGSFASLTAMTASDDSYVRFVQFRNTVFALTDQGSLKAYNSAATTTVITPDVSGDISTDVYLDPITAAANGELPDSTRFFYRFTFDYQMENDFLFESKPMNTEVVGVGTQWEELSGDTDAGTNNKLEINKDLSGASSWPDGATRMNIYRSESYALSATKSQFDADTQMWYLASVTKAEYDAIVGAPWVLYTDTGADPLDYSRQISYIGIDEPPNCRYGCMHKSRLWLANTPNDPFAIYVSNLNEPMKFRATGNVPRTSSAFNAVDSGAQINGIMSWRNEKLIFWTDTAMYEIVGSADEAAEGFPDIEVRRISDDIGCIAPESITSGDGAVVWLSNRGFYFYDGTSPRTLDNGAEEIRPILDAIPAARRYYVCCEYYSKRREFWAAVTENGETENKLILKYDLRTGGWTTAKYTDTSIVGYNFFKEQRSGDEAGQLLGFAGVSGGTHVHNMVSGLSDPGTTYYDCTMEGGYDDFGAPDQLKEFTAITIPYKVLRTANTSSAVTVDVYIDGDDGTVIETFDLASVTYQTTHVEHLDNCQGHKMRIDVTINEGEGGADDVIMPITVRVQAHRELTEP